MNTVKSTIIALLLGAVVSNQAMPDQDPNLFSLDEDKLIIDPTFADKPQDDQDNFFLDDDKFI